MLHRLLTLPRRVQHVKLPDGSDAFVRELTSAEVIQFSENQKTDPVGAASMLIVHGVVENDRPVFTFDDLPKIRQMPYAFANALVDGILQISGLKDAPEKKHPTSNVAAVK